MNLIVFPPTTLIIGLTAYLVWHAYRTKGVTPNAKVAPPIRLKNIAILLAASLAVISAVVVTGWLITSATTPHQYTAHIGDGAVLGPFPSLAQCNDALRAARQAQDGQVGQALADGWAERGTPRLQQWLQRQRLVAQATCARVEQP